MKNIHLLILILGLWAPIAHAAQTKESAQEQAKNAATLDLASAIYRLDTSGVINALDEGASLTTLVRAYTDKPDTFYLAPDSSGRGYPCMAILVEAAKKTNPHAFFPDGRTAKQAITDILYTLVDHDLDINAPAELTDKTFKQHDSPLLVALDSTKLNGEKNQALEDLYFIKALLDNRADINKTYLSGSTPLMQTINVETPTIFKLLLEYGANTTIKDAQEHDIMYHINKSSKKDAFLKIFNDYKETARKAAQQETAGYITRDPASLVVDYFVEENPEITAIREKKSKQEEEYEEDEE